NTGRTGLSRPAGVVGAGWAASQALAAGVRDLVLTRLQHGNGGDNVSHLVVVPVVVAIQLAGVETAAVEVDLLNGMAAGESHLEANAIPQRFAGIFDLQRLA